MFARIMQGVVFSTNFILTLQDVVFLAVAFISKKQPADFQ